MSFLEIFLLIFPLMLISSFGYILSIIKKRCDIQAISDIIIYITAPALVISSLSGNSFNAKDSLWIAFVSASVILLSVFFVWIVKRKIEIPQSFYIVSCFMNSGFIGIPLCLAFFGVQGLTTAIIYDATNVIIIFSLGIYLMSGNKHRFEVFKMPLIYATFFGVLINYLNLQIPSPVKTSFMMLGNATIPLALIMIGYKLGCIRISSFKLPFFAVFSRLVVGFLISYMAVKLLPIPYEIGKILIVLSSLPSAITGIVFSEKYLKTESDFVASSIALSTILSIIYIPLILFLL